VQKLCLFRPVSSRTDAVESSINDNLQLPTVLYFSTLGEHLLGLCRGKPCRIASRFVRCADVFHLQQESLDHKLLYTSRFPKHTFRVDIEVEVPGLNPPCDAGLFQGLAFGSQAVG
jgi:hypothetical protein